jgi:hypothetical protein
LTPSDAVTRRWSADVPPAGRAIATGLVTALLVYAAYALAAGWWISGLAAPVVAGLLAMRHARARFSAYVFFSVVAVRGLFGRSLLVLGFAVAAVLVLQARAARRAWPRLAGRRRR